jgi:hypothetical protein
MSTKNKTQEGNAELPLVDLSKRYLTAEEAANIAIARFNKKVEEIDRLYESKNQNLTTRR